MTTISPVSLPNLYELPTRSAETATQLTAGPSIGEKVAIDLRENPSTRTLPDEAYRKAAAEILRKTNYFMDLAGLGLR